jgi:hypothetical protein
LKIAAVVCDVYDGGNEVFSDKSYQNRELLIGSSPVRSKQDLGPHFKPTRNRASMTIVIVNLSLSSDINKHSATTRHRRDVIREAEADTLWANTFNFNRIDGLAKPCCTAHTRILGQRGRRACIGPLLLRIGMLIRYSDKGAY